MLYNWSLQYLISASFFRKSYRRTAINGLVALSSFCNIIGISHVILVVISNEALCTSALIAFPIVTLLQKMNLTALAVVRHTYIFCSSLIYKNDSAALMIFLPTTLCYIAISMTPLLTLFFEPHPLWQTCNLILHPGDPSFHFVITYFIILLQSLFVDIICYVRILNFMRVNRVRVTVVATSRSERLKSQNIVTAPSSFLIWLVSVVSMIPSSLMLISSNESLTAKHVMTLIHYQEVLAFVLGILMPILYIGSSAELRKELDLIRRYVFRLRSEQQTQEIYTINEL